MGASRPDRELNMRLLAATKSYEEESVAGTFLHVLPTYLLIVFGVATISWFKSWYLLPLSLLLGLLYVRSFIIFHDTMHGAIFRGSRVGRSLVNLFSILSIFPPSVWRFRHNAHHKQNTRLNDILTEGQFPIVSVSVYKKLSEKLRWRYRASRHPMMFFIAYIRYFLYESLKTFRKNPRIFWTAILWVVLHFGLIAMIWYLFGGAAMLMSLLLPLWIASMIGAYLFYVQHNFEEMELSAFENWSHVDAALHGSSMFDMPRIMHWFTGNIGYHHIHHLNSRIPFYRLPETYRNIEELQSPGRFRLSLSTLVNSFNLMLWDEQRSALVSLEEASV